MKKLLVIFFFILSGNTLFAQMTLAACQEKALMNYPLLRQTGLIREAEDYSLSAANTSYLPHFTLSGKASYQSEVTALSIPGMVSNSVSQDQYQIMMEISQPLWDGGMTASQKGILEASSKLDREALEIELYALKERVNQIYFGILLLEERLIQNALFQEELESNTKKVQSLLNYGIASISDLNALKVEQLNALQSETNLKYGINSYKKMLAKMIGSPLPETVLFVRPESKSQNPSHTAANRPEISLFHAKLELLDAQRELLKSKKMPQLYAFLQGGYGRPGYNMLDDSFRTYYLTGLRFIWSLDGFYTSRSDQESIELDKQKVQTEIESFLYNTSLQIESQQSEIERLNQLIQKDEEIIILRKSIKEDAEIRLENGTMSVNDLLREISAENLARQSKSLHEIQLLQSLFQLSFTTN